MCNGCRLLRAHGHVLYRVSATASSARLLAAWAAWSSAVAAMAAAAAATAPLSAVPEGGGFAGGGYAGGEAVSSGGGSSEAASQVEGELRRELAAAVTRVRERSLTIANLEQRLEEQERAAGETPACFI